MARSSPLPGLDEYVVARGPELLRTAWLLTGDEVRARELVEQALATLWRRRTGRDSLTPGGDDTSLDTAARYAVVRRYARRSLRPRGDPAAARARDPEGLNSEFVGSEFAGAEFGSSEFLRSTSRDAVFGQHADELGALRRDLLAALDRLTPVQRAVVVLYCDEGLDDAEIADVLARRVGTVHTERARALAALGHVAALAETPDHHESWDEASLSDASLPDASLPDASFPDDSFDLAERVGTALREIVPERYAGGYVDTAELAAGARRYAAHTRRRRGAAWVGGVAAVLAVGSLVAFTVQRDRSASLAAKPPTLTCAGVPLERAAPHAGGAALSTRARAALVCADRSNSSIWPGSLPPDEPLSDPRGLDYLVLGPPVNKDIGCSPLPVGPAFTITVQGKDGRSQTYDNVDLACNGWPTLDRYFIALGEQQAVESFNPRIDPFPPCPSILGQRLRPRSDGAQGTPGVPQGTVFTAGSACLHQSPDATQVPGFSSLRPKRSVLGATELAALTREAATHPSGASSTGCDDVTRSGPVVVVRAVTSQGTLVELTGSKACGLELLVNWTPGDYWTVTRATADAVAADFGGFPR